MSDPTTTAAHQECAHPGVRRGAPGPPDPAESTDLARALTHATAVLAAAGIESARADAELLAAHVLSVSRGRVGALAVAGHRMEHDDARRLGALVAGRARRTPLQHLTGASTFRTVELQVGPGVFLPRPETEIVAGLAVDALRRARQAEPGQPGHTPIAVDLCTGSGAIAAALAAEVPDAMVHAVELDPVAARWARLNLGPVGVVLHRADVRTVLGELAELAGRADVVVSNPPYVPDGRTPEQPEAGQDPGVALYGGGADGMRMPAAIVAAGARLLRPGGVLVMEHDETQQRAVAAVLGRDGLFTEIAGHEDLTGRPRCTTARRVTSDDHRRMRE